MVICSYCQAGACLTNGEEIYPHRKDLAHLAFHICRPCKAYVGCHKGTTNPLGRLANAELRKAKSAAHKAFDPLWLYNGNTRKAAYKWLAKAMNLEPKDCHIGMFDLEQCAKVKELCHAKRN